MDKSLLTEMTIEEFRALIKETVRETIREWLCETVDPNDPDAGLEFRPEVAEYLQKVLRGEEEYVTWEDATRELGLDE